MSYLTVHSVGLYMEFFFFNDTATTEIYTLSLHDALPIYHDRWAGADVSGIPRDRGPDGGEDPGPDDRADAERGELEGTERALESAADLAVGDALVDGLATEELRARQRAAPAPA